PSISLSTLVMGSDILISPPSPSGLGSRNLTSGRLAMTVWPTQDLSAAGENAVQIRRRVTQRRIGRNMGPPSLDHPVSGGKRYSLWRPVCGLGENRRNALTDKPFQYLLRNSRNLSAVVQADFGQFSIFLSWVSISHLPARDRQRHASKAF